MRLIKRASSERMLAEVAMTLTFMFNQELAHTFVEKNQPLLRALRASPVDPD
jgi:hypothetical protein